MLLEKTLGYLPNVLCISSLGYRGIEGNGKLDEGPLNGLLLDKTMEGMSEMLAYLSNVLCISSLDKDVF